MKKIILMLVLLVMIVGCTKETTSTNALVNELLVKDQIIVGISPDYPPFEDLSTSGEIIGFDVDMMNEVLSILNKNEELNLKVTWKSMDFDTIIGALQTKQIDIGVSGFTYDADRDVYFTTPYIISQQVIVVSVTSGINDVVALEGKKIGVQSGTTGEGAAEEIVGAKLVSLTDAQQLFAQLQTNAIDAVVIDKAVADNFIKNNNGFVLVSEPLIDENMSIIIGKGNTNLQVALDKAIQEFIQSGKYQELLTKWEIEQ